MNHPNDEQLRQYSQKLPDIYQAILKAFPLTVPLRRVGDGLAEESILDSLLDTAPEVLSDEVSEALDQLTVKGFLSQHPKLRFFSPTALGERLITILTGNIARKKGVPPLPELTWS